MKGIQHFLLASGISVISIGLLYGVTPKIILEGIVGLSVQDNELHIFRAIMGLYCGVGGLLIAGALNKEHIRSALVLETVFLGSLASGRLLSFAVDGNFHWFALLATGIEIPLFIICVTLLKYLSNTTQKIGAIGA
jgi:hypothetical protein